MFQGFVCLHFSNVSILESLYSLCCLQTPGNFGKAFNTQRSYNCFQTHQQLQKFQQDYRPHLIVRLCSM